MSVVILPEVRAYLKDLPQILYEKEYFGFEEQARKYVVDLLDNITARLPHPPHKPAPPYVNRYGKGMYYATFRRSKLTAWYAFFTKYDSNGEVVYLIRYLTNSHVAAQRL